MKGAVGVDIGGSKIAVGAVDGEGRVLRRTALPTDPDRGFDDAVERIAGAIRSVLADAGRDAAGLRGIGIGCAGPVDPVRGTIHNPYTLPGWDGRDLVTPLRERFGVPVVLENDADAAALGESRFGAGRGASPVVLLTFGTGIGGAAVVDGRIYRGAAGEHPELGHIRIDPEGPPCYCGIRGCLESLASGTAIGGAGREAGLGSCRDVFRAAAAGEPRARRIVDRAVAAAADAAWTIFHALLPERLVLGGGIAEDHHERFAGAIRDRIAGATLVPRGRIAVAKAALGADAGVVGASCLVLFPPA